MADRAGERVLVVEEVVPALELPEDAMVDQRVPKKLLLEHGAITPADRRRIREGVEEIRWLAALKPTTVGVPEHRTEEREYLEVAVIRMELRAEADARRLVELLHRAVPYPTFLLTRGDAGIELSLAHKRWSRSGMGVSVLDGRLVRVRPSAEDGELVGPFLAALALARQPRSDLRELYSGWLDVLTAFEAGSLTGTFELSGTSDRRQARGRALKEYRELEARIATVKAAAEKERQMARRVELNMELNQLRAALQTARSRL